MDTVPILIELNGRIDACPRPSGADANEVELNRCVSRNLPCVSRDLRRLLQIVWELAIELRGAFGRPARSLSRCRIDKEPLES